MFNIIAQAAPATGPNPMLNIIFIGMLVMVFYFFIIRPQNKRIKDHKTLLTTITRGDTIVTNGGLVGKVKKVADDELTVDFNGSEIKVIRNMIADVRGRPVAAANDTAKDTAKKPSNKKPSKKK